MDDWSELNGEIVACRRCPRLVQWREQIAREKVKRFAEEEYWGKPVTGFGDPGAQLLVIGLAPAAHGANRTGRMFTGDRSGEWLYRTLYAFGFADKPLAVRRDDVLRLSNCYITAAVRCAPPQNKPSREELRNCRDYLLREIAILKNVNTVVGLGKTGYTTAILAFTKAGRIEPARMPEFYHGAEFSSGGIVFIASYHPSQQNTFTGTLTRQMFDAIFRRCREILEKSEK